jgi:hypothetical protein
VTPNEREASRDGLTSQNSDAMRARRARRRR